MKKIENIGLSLLAFLIPFILYTLTLAPSYIPVDSAEFTLCINDLGICHPPGFPLYILIGKIFTIIFPFGELIFKTNLLSALFGALTALVVYLTLLKLNLQKYLAFLLVQTLSISQPFWEFSISTDIFTFASFLIALTFYLALSKRKYLSFFVLGLTSSHFYITAIIFPILIWYFFGIKKFYKQKLFGLIIFLLGFFPQGLMFIRMSQNPEINWGHVKNFEDFVHFILRKEFGSVFLIPNINPWNLPLNLLNHFLLYAKNLILNFGLILPFLAIFLLIKNKLLEDKNFLLIGLSFLSLFVFQLILLSSINPLSEGKNFQLTKFYLPTFTLFTLICAMTLSKLQKSFYIYLIYGFILLITILIFSNYSISDLSKNYQTRDLILDALSELPPKSLAITYKHQIYFGKVYEQKVHHLFEDIDMLYFPNEYNRDVESYYPQYFKNPPDQDFIKKVEKDQNLGAGEKYILNSIAKNLDKRIFILQGTFGEQFFAYLKPYLKPYGLWWELKVDPNSKVDTEKSKLLLEKLITKQIKKSDYHESQQQLDALVYGIAFHGTALELAKEGNYDQALRFLNKSAQINTEGTNVKAEMELINEIKSLENSLTLAVNRSNVDILTKLGSDYFTIGRFDKAIDIFEVVTVLDPKNGKLFHNLGSAYIKVGKKDQAILNFERALELDPTLNLSRKALEELKKS